MALPKQSAPVYNLTIPSTGEKIKYRPFLVKDEKALLIAQQSNDASIMIDTLKETIRNCTESTLDVDKLALFDIEYIFCKLRAKSVGEIIELTLTCGNCGNKVNTSIDISKIEVEKSEDHTKKFLLFNNVGICMKYPSYELLTKLRSVAEEQVENLDVIFSVIVSCVDYIYDDDQIYYAKDTPTEELLEFVNNLTKDQLEKITKFFDTIPKLKKDMSHTCNSCGTYNRIVLEGLNNFF